MAGNRRFQIVGPSAKQSRFEGVVWGGRGKREKKINDFSRLFHGVDSRVKM